jgi:plasmid stabilization system protein ParE
VTPGPWTARLARAAEADLAEIAQWTAREFGARQADAYIALLVNGLRLLQDGPLALGTSDLRDITPGLRSLRPHRVRHVLIYRADSSGRAIEIVRILNDAMDPTRHLSPDDAGSA